MFYKGLGSIQLVIFFTSGPVDKKFHTNSPMTNLFHIWDQSQQDIFINAWDQSHSSFFFTIGITLHKSSNAQYHDKSILYFGSVPTVCFVKAWDRSHWSFFNIIGTTRQKKLFGQSHYKSISHLGSVPTVNFHKGLGLIPLVIFLYHWYH